MFTERKTCRLCDGDLESVISLGDIHLSTFLDTNDNPPPKIPLELTLCQLCDLMQLKHTVHEDVMYSDYWYQSGLNGSMVKALADVVQKVFQHVELNENDVVVDIGANDGTLLSNYPSYLYRVAFEPSNLYRLAAGKADLIINDYFNEAVYSRDVPVQAKVITAIAMFYDLEHPHTFVEDLKKILDPDGIIVIQMMDLMSMVRYGDFPNICHEHLEYYTLRVFNQLMRQHQLEVYHVEYNGVNGGSMRAYIRHEVSPDVTANVFNALRTEQLFFAGIGDVGTYFKNKIEDVRLKIVQLIKDINTANMTVAVMGASTKGNTILQYFGLTDKDIIHAAEVNPDKFGKRTVGSNIPIISQQISMRHVIDYYLILPWGFIDNFVDRNKTYLMNGGAFIVPLPEPRIITMTKEGELCTNLL